MLTLPLGRRLAAGSLLATALLSVISVALAPEFPSDYAERITAVADGGTAAVLSALAFTLAQLPFLVAVLAIAAMIRPRSPRLAAVGATFGVLGGFGHAVFGGISAVQVEMAADAENLGVYAGLLEAVESSPAAIPFLAAGLIGTVLGILLLSIGLWRSGVGPRWVAPLLWAFLVVEFVGAGLSDYASYVAGLCYLIAFGALARHVMSEDTTTATEPERVLAG